MSVTAIGATTNVNAPGRIVDLLCVPYGEMSHLTGNPAGERVQYGAFAEACRHPDKVFLMVGHDHLHPVGRAFALWEEADGLHGTFRIRESALGDEVLADLHDGYLPACSVGFRPTTVGRGPKGETVVMAGDLREVSLLPIGAYDSARVLALRNATDRPGTWSPRLLSRMSTTDDVATSPWLTGRGRLGTIKL